MPLSTSRLQGTVYNGIKAAFTADTSTASQYTAIADAQWQKIAQAIAAAVVAEITGHAQVNPGIPTAGGPTSQVTTGPGTIS